MRKVIITVATSLSLLLPATAFASGHKHVKQRHARSVKHAKAKTSKRSRHADNDRTLLTPKWT